MEGDRCNFDKTRERKEKIKGTRTLVYIERTLGLPKNPSPPLLQGGWRWKKNSKRCNNTPINVNVEVTAKSFVHMLLNAHRTQPLSRVYLTILPVSGCVKHTHLCDVLARGRGTKAFQLGGHRLVDAPSRRLGLLHHHLAPVEPLVHRRKERRCWVRCRVGAGYKYSLLRKRN